MTSASNGPTPADDEGDDIPFDALAEILAGPDGDSERGRDAARRLLGLTESPVPVEVPRPAPDAARDVDVVSWLHQVLAAEERRADAATGDLEQYVWLGDRLGWVPESSRTRARVQAERALLALHDRPHECPGAGSAPPPSACPVVLHLALGRRFDAEGWRPDWAPTP